MKPKTVSRSFTRGSYSQTYSPKFCHPWISNHEVGLSDRSIRACISRLLKGNGGRKSIPAVHVQCKICAIITDGMHRAWSGAYHMLFSSIAPEWSERILWIIVDSMKTSINTIEIVAIWRWSRIPHWRYLLSRGSSTIHGGSCSDLIASHLTLISCRLHDIGSRIKGRVHCKRCSPFSFFIDKTERRKQVPSFCIIQPAYCRSWIAAEAAISILCSLRHGRIMWTWLRATGSWVWSRAFFDVSRNAL